MEAEAGRSLKLPYSIKQNDPDGCRNLAGGSSNAALMLHMINTIEELEMNDDELASLGVRLGADVPIFVHGRTALA